jgi:hypothetical protein
MRQQRKQEPERNETLRLWTYTTAVKAVPYVHSVVRSIREHWLEGQSAQRRIDRLDAQPGRPDRHTLIRRAETVQEFEQGYTAFEEALEELRELSAVCLDPTAGLALLPFGQGEDLAWFVFDLFAPRGLVAWRLHSDPLEARRPLLQDPAAALPAYGGSLLEVSHAQDYSP